MASCKISKFSFSLAFGLLWALALFFAGFGNLMVPGYGEAFLKTMSSLYPGYDGASSMRSVLIGTGYALVDGAIAGFLFAWFYNLFVRISGAKEEKAGENNLNDKSE